MLISRDFIFDQVLTNVMSKMHGSIRLALPTTKIMIGHFVKNKKKTKSQLVKIFLKQTEELLHVF